MLKPFAILDTDFISKLYSTKNSKGIPFIEKIFEFDYEFFCHNQILIELTRHNGKAKDWLQNNSDKIKILKDIDILNLFENYHLPDSVACRYYENHLRSACKIYSQSYFDSCYGKLHNNLNSIDNFLTELSLGDNAVGQKNNLGEVKNTVLLNALNLCTKNTVYKFCSDDQDTRAHILAYATRNNFDLKCISPFSFFYIAKNELSINKNDADEFFLNWISNKSNAKIKVIGCDGVKRTQDSEIIYSDIWAEKVNCTREGYIKY